jgi:hypothetical protein
VDVFLPGPGGAQIHDLNPSTFPPVGLFWTLQISDERQTDDGNGVDVNLGTGGALLQVSNAPILDYGNIGNALFGGGPPQLATSSSNPTRSERLPVRLPKSVTNGTGFSSLKETTIPARSRLERETRAE